MLSHRNPKRISEGNKFNIVILMLLKELEWKPRMVSKWEKERKHGSNRSWEKTQDKFCLWHYLLLLSLQSCLTLCDLIDGSPPGSPVPGILQARTLEWVAIAFSIAGK